MRAASRTAAVAVLLALLACGSACSIKTIAVNSLGKALASGGDIYARDDDPELVAGAIPFGLKTIESLLETSPRNADLLIAAASGFTQYSYAFVQLEADYTEARDFERAMLLRARALKLYKRALAYGLRGLEVRHPGFLEKLRDEPENSLRTMTRADVPLLYWTAAAWGAAMSNAKDDSELVADQGLVFQMVRRVSELDEGFGGGAAHDLLISFEARPASAGGSPGRAREHFLRAVTLSKGERAAPYVSFAESVLLPAQNKAEFESVLKEAIAIDVEKAPGYRLANLIAQKRARWLLGRAGELFLD